MCRRATLELADEWRNPEVSNAIWHFRALSVRLVKLNAGPLGLEYLIGIAEASKAMGGRPAPPFGIKAEEVGGYLLVFRFAERVVRLNKLKHIDSASLIKIVGRELLDFGSEAVPPLLTGKVSPRDTENIQMVIDHFTELRDTIGSGIFVAEQN